MTTLAVLLAALLFGGMTLFSFGFAAVLFSVYGPDLARKGIRGAFPHYYLWVCATATVAALCAFVIDAVAGVALLCIALSTVYARQGLMVRINAATDTQDTARFKRLHGFSVVLQLIQIGLAGWVLVWIAG